MTKRLILIRHAKSSWDDPFADDHARRLNARGLGAAKAIGAWLASKAYLPDVILCSDATRTQETATLILAALSPQPPLLLSAPLYHAAPQTLRDVIGQQKTPTLALIGHNPGLGMLADMLVAERPAHPHFGSFPTCATAVIDFDIDDWRSMIPRSGTCVDFIVPRDLDEP